jgi:hypothetical protein
MFAETTITVITTIFCVKMHKDKNYNSNDDLSGSN